MLRSLVGSEMCIRDRIGGGRPTETGNSAPVAGVNQDARSLMLAVIDQANSRETPDPFWIAHDRSIMKTTDLYCWPESMNEAETRDGAFETRTLPGVMLMVDRG